MIRKMIAVAALGAMTACAPAVPDSATGVGFDNSIAAQRAREAALTGQPVLPAPTAISNETLPTASDLPPLQSTTTASVTATATAQPVAGANPDVILEAAASLEQTQANSGVPPLQASPTNPEPQLLSNPGISDENDFQAVSSRETIESDAQRIAQNRAQYQIVQPTAVPNRSEGAQPNIVQYALQTSHPKGTRLYTRTGLNLAARASRNCATYASPDQAQIDFLARGGPRRDRKGLDPDGDGYACAWDPTPFRTAVQN